ncbi:MAG TPA: hypothetical protein VNI20_04255, partial [Fimbriimonadaceae bacterium]|nr:hypothetical protein [Fimbriimonadaceae bacterium]
MSTVAELPKWDVSCYFPGIGSEEFDQELKAIHADVLALRDTYDTIGVGAGSSIDFSSGLVGNVEKVISADNALSDRMKLARAYIHSFVTTDASDDVAQAKQSQMQGSMIIAGKLTTRFYAWVGRLPLDSLLAESSVARDHKFALRKAKTMSEKMMSPEEEALATDLSESGGSAWARLYGNFSSQISVPFDGKTLPISAVRNLAYDADAAVRKAAFEAELAAWKENEVVIAAAMNAIKYETELVSRKRGWASVLDGALFSTNIDAATLDAMMSASHAAFPAFRRYLGAKSRLLGNSGALPWHDLFAPVGDGGAWSYSRAQSFVE